MIAQGIQGVAAGIRTRCTHAPDLERYLVKVSGDIQGDLTFSHAFPHAKDQGIVRTPAVQDAVGQQPTGPFMIDPLTVGQSELTALEDQFIFLATGNDGHEDQEEGEVTGDHFHLSNNFQQQWGNRFLSPSTQVIRNALGGGDQRAASHLIYLSRLLTRGKCSILLNGAIQRPLPAEFHVWPASCRRGSDFLLRQKVTKNRLSPKWAFFIIWAAESYRYLIGSTHTS